jgi:WD40 repeat protein
MKFFFAVFFCGAVLFVRPLVLQAQQAHLILPIGHSGKVWSAEFSPDNRRVVTAAQDETVKVWDVQSGQLLTTLRPKPADISFAGFSADGRKIIAYGGFDGTEFIWDAVTDSLLAVEKPPSREEFDAGRSLPKVKPGLSNADSSRLATTDSGRVRLTNSITGKTIALLKPGNGILWSDIFSGDGKRLVIYSHENAWMYDAGSGRLLDSLVGNTDSLMSVQPGPDGSRLITFYNQPLGDRAVWMAVADTTAKLWAMDKTGGRLLTELKGHRERVTGATFSTDGKMIAVGSEDGTTSVWRASTGQLLYMLREKSAINTWAFSPDGTMIVTGAFDGTATIRDAQTGAALTRLAGHAIEAGNVQYSPDGSKLAVQGHDNLTRVWDNGAGKLLFCVTKDLIPLATSWSPDGRRFLYCHGGDTLRILDATTGKEEQTLRVPGFFQDASWSADGRQVRCASTRGLVLWDCVRDSKQLLPLYDTGYSQEIFCPDDSQVLTITTQATRLWAIPSGRLLQEFPAMAVYSLDIPDNGFIYEMEESYNRLARFSPDGKKLLLLNPDSSQLWDIAGRQGVFLSNKKVGALYSAEFTEDGHYIIGKNGFADDVYIFEAATGQLFLTIPEDIYLSGKIKVAPNGKEFAFALSNGEVQFIGIPTGRVLRTLHGLNDVYHLAYSPDGQTLVTVTGDRTIRVWDAAEAKLRYSLVVLDSTDYLAIDPRGRYDGSEAGKKMLYYTCGREIVDLEQLKSLSWEPGLVAKIMGIDKEPITARPTDSMDICGYTPLVEEEGLRNGSYQWAITRRAGGIGEIELFVNNKLIRTYSPAALPVQGDIRRLVVPAAAVEPYFTATGRNQVLVRATTHDGTMSSRGIPIVARLQARAQRDPDMYILSIGVSKYKDTAIALHYAAKDATDFSHATAMAARRLLNTDGRDHVHVWTCGTDPGDRLWPDRHQIKALFDSIAARAQANDILILFFAGHGVLRKGESNYYLLTQEAASFDQINSIPGQVAISTDEIERWMRTVKANKQLLILDACGSGQAINNLHGLVAKRGIPADQQRALEKLKDQTGTFILSASAADEGAYETSLYSQGLLTYSLLTGMKQGSGLRDQQYVDVSRWFNAAADEVKVLARDIGGRQDPQLLGTASFDVGIVDRQIAESIVLARPGKIFVRSVLIGDEVTLGDSLRLSALIDQQLNELAVTSRGGGLTFLADNNGSDSTYSIRGRYVVVNGQVRLNVSLYQGRKEKLQTLEEIVPMTDPVALAQYIVKRLNPYFDQP